MMNMPTGAYSSQMGQKNKVPQGYSLSKINQFTPEQHELFGQIFGNLGPESWLSKLAAGNEGEFEALEAPALKQFSGQLGGLASRFSGLGQGDRKSSGFQNTANQAAADFASQLQSQRLELKNQAMKDLMGFSNQFLNQRPYEQQLAENPEHFLSSLFSGLSGGFGNAIGSKLGAKI